MAKLAVEIVAYGVDAAELLKILAVEEFKAKDIHRIEGTETYDIDDGMNDIRAKIEKNHISFYCRYKSDIQRYEDKIRKHCLRHALESTNI